MVVHTNCEETFGMGNVLALATGRVLLTVGGGGVAEYLRSKDDHGQVGRRDRGSRDDRGPVDAVQRTDGEDARLAEEPRRLHFNRF